MNGLKNKKGVENIKSTPCPNFTSEPKLTILQ